MMEIIPPILGSYPAWSKTRCPRVTLPSEPSAGKERPPHTEVGKENIVACQVGRGDHGVRLVDEVVDLLVGGDDQIEVAVVAYIRRADQITPIPRYDEVRPSILIPAPITIRSNG